MSVPPGGGVWWTMPLPVTEFPLALNCLLCLLMEHEPWEEPALQADRDLKGFHLTWSMWSTMFIWGGIMVDPTPSSGPAGPFPLTAECSIHARA